MSTQFPSTINPLSLSPSQELLVNGFPALSSGAAEIAGVGDVNGDGIPDIAYGATNTASGTCYVIFGNPNLGTLGQIDVSTLTGTNGFRIIGFPANSLGYMLSPLGDINGDGLSDFGIVTGSAYVFFGNPNIGSGGTFNVTGLNGNNGFIVATGLTTPSSLRNTIAGIGDVNGDGFSDVGLGIPSYSNNAGLAIVIYGASNVGSTGTINISNLNGSNGFTVTGFSASDWGGYSLTGGDFDGDGISDPAIGAPTLAQVGAVYVIRGNKNLGGGGTLNIASLTGPTGFVVNNFAIPGLAKGGYSVANMDLNSDGFKDLLVGAPFASGQGASFLFFGSPGIGSSGTLSASSLNGNNGFSITGLPISGQGGSWVSGAGDINDGGFSSLVISAPGAGSGQSYCIFGSKNIGMTGNFDVSTLTGSNGFGLSGFLPGSFGGNPIVGVGDVNDDGIDDIAYGASYAFNQRGQGYLLFGDTPCLLTQNKLSIQKGNTVIFTHNNLNATYPKRPSWYPNVKYIFTNIQHGYFSFDKDTYVPIYQCTNQNITDGVVQFTHDDSPFPPSYGIKLPGNGGLMSMPMPQTATITFIHQGGVLVNNQLPISQGQPLTLNSNQLSALNLDLASDNPNLIFILSDVVNGYFQLTGSPGVPISSFTQALVQTGSVQFVPTGGTSAPSFNVAVSDGSITTSPVAANISFNLAPTLNNNSLPINQGQPTIITSNMLSATDLDNPAPSLTFLVSGVQHGQFELLSSPGNAINSFTQSQVQNGKVRFVPDGTAIAPSCSVSVTDGLVATTPQPANVIFNMAPILTKNQFIINQGETITIGNNTLSATDPDGPDANLEFIFSGVQHASFHSPSSLSSISNFTQPQVRNLQVQFTTDGGTKSPSCNVAVSDGKMTIPFTPCQVNFDTTPLFTTNTFAFNQGQPITISPANLAVTKPDHSQPFITFTVSNVTNGYFQSISAPQQRITTFTQNQVQNSLIQFVPDGSTNAPSFSISASDGIVTTSAQTPTITFNVTPQIVNNNFVITQGQSLMVTNSMLSAYDPQESNDNIIFLIGNTQYGHFESTVNPGVILSSFSQTQILNNQIKFFPDGSSNTPSFTVSVTDGKTSSPAQVAQTTYYQLPITQANTLSINQGQIIPITSDNLSATLEGSASPDLIFTITNMVGGQFAYKNNPQAAITSFTQDDIQKNRVVFVQDGTSKSPAYSVSASYSVNPPNSSSALSISSSSSKANIIFNALPQLGNNQITLQQGASQVITSNALSATDDQASTDELIFKIENPQHVQFQNLNNLGTSITSFAQQQVRTGNIMAITDDSGIKPSYNVSVLELLNNNGVLQTPSSPAIVNFQPSLEISTPADNTMEKTFLGVGVSGAFGFLFWFIRNRLNNALESNLEKQLSRSRTAESVPKLHNKIIKPLIKKVFQKLKTTTVLGCRSPEDTSDYIDAITKIVLVLNALKFDFTKETETKERQEQIINELTDQIRNTVAPKKGCFSRFRNCSYFKQDVTPKQISDRAVQIAKDTYEALTGKKAPENIEDLDSDDLERNRSLSHIEMQSVSPMQTPLYDLKTQDERIRNHDERIIKLEEQARLLQPSLSSPSNSADSSRVNSSENYDSKESHNLLSSNSMV